MTTAWCGLQALPIELGHLDLDLDVPKTAIAGAMVVDLPAPFGPGKSGHPSRGGRAGQPVDGVASAMAFRELLDADHHAVLARVGT
jgi:hypothetical protein